MRLNETCNMIIEQEYIENVVFSQPDVLRVPAGRDCENVNFNFTEDEMRALNIQLTDQPALPGPPLLAVVYSS